MTQPTRLQRLQIGLAAAALLLTALVGLFFVAQVLMENEACYGVSAFNNPCEPASPSSIGRLLLVITIVLAAVRGSLARRTKSATLAGALGARRRR